MRSFIYCLLIVAGITIISCSSEKPAEEKTTSQPLEVDTTEGEARSDSAAPVFAEPDSVPGVQSDTTE